MYARVNVQRRRRGMGDVCSVDRNGNRVCGPNPSGLGVTIARSSPLISGVRAVKGTMLPSTAGNEGNSFPVTAFPVAYPNPSPILTYGGSSTSQPQPITPPWGGWNKSYSGGMSTQALAQLIQIYNTNPTALSPAQWSQLQQAGIIPSTLPYSSASLVQTTSAPTVAASSVVDPQCVAAGMTGGPYPNCIPLASATGTDFFSTQYGPLTGLEWVGVAVAAYFLLMKGRR